MARIESGSIHDFNVDVYMGERPVFELGKNHTMTCLGSVNHSTSDCPLQDMKN